jgi:hypothetical protein
MGFKKKCFSTAFVGNKTKYKMVMTMMYSNATFQKLDLSPFSGDGAGDIYSVGFVKEIGPPSLDWTIAGRWTKFRNPIIPFNKTL